jgi:cyclophilin family peptidyl-prolyl cis-trans isomerase/HEAT repeat protein
MSAFALGLLGSDIGIQRLESRLEVETSSDVRAVLALSLGRIGGEAQVKKLAQFLDRTNIPWEAAHAAQGLGLLWQKDSASWGVPDGLIAKLIFKAQSTDRDESLSAAFALTRYKGPSTQVSLDDLLNAIHLDILPESRGLLIRALGKQKIQASRDALCSILPLPNMTDGVYVETLRALASVKINKCTDDFFMAALHHKSALVRIQALQSVANFGSDISQKLKSNLLKILESSTSPWEQGEALTALAKIDPASSTPFIDHRLTSSSVLELRQGLKALTSLSPSNGQLKNVVHLLQHRTTNVVEDAIAVISTVSDSLLDSLPGGLTQLQNSLSVLLAKGDMAIIANIADLAKDKKWDRLAMDLAKSYEKLTAPDDVEAKLSVLSALAEIGSRDILTTLEVALKDDERLVALAAADAIKKITGQDVSNRVPERSVIRAATPSIQELVNATQSRLQVDTTKGPFFVKMNSEAPLTSANIVKLSRNGFYNGLAFHRVVPNFVAQGGDPRGDGYGGPGYLIRDEVSLENHARGAIGIATAGKDTGGCQFFINHATNRHLDGTYTVFGNVVGGMVNIDKLEIGDKILRIVVTE